MVQINEAQLTLKEFGQLLAQAVKSYDAITAKDPATLSRVKEEILNDFIVSEIIKQWAKTNGVTVSFQETEDEVKRMRGGYPNDLTFRDALASEGVSIESWKKRIHFSLLQRKVFEQIKKSLPSPTEEELRSYYTSQPEFFDRKPEVRLQQIVVKKKSDAQYIFEQIKKGGDFGSLAKQYSIAPESENLGVTDWIEKGSLDVFEIAFTLPIGQLSKILKSPYGFHIYKVVERKPGGKLSFEQGRESAKSHLLNIREQGAFTGWLETQARSSKISRDEKLIDSIKIETLGPSEK